MKKRIAIILCAVTLIAIFVEPGLVVNGLLLGSALALGAVGVSLVFGILRFAHVAHGDFMALGAYVALFVTATLLPKLGFDQAGLGPFTFGYPLLLALPVAMIVGAGSAILIDRFIYRHLRDRGARPATMLITSLAVAICLRAIIQMVWGTQPEQYPRVSRVFFQLPLDIRIPPDNIFLGVVAFLCFIGLYVLLYRTRLGKAMRAVSDNPNLALMSGIDTERVIAWTWAIGVSLAVLAGVLFAVSQAQLLPIIGWKVLIPIFAAVILGGIGNVWGALIGAFIIGVTMEVSTEWISPSYKPAVAFAILVIVLMFRPRGIFGRGKT